MQKGKQALEWRRASSALGKGPAIRTNLKNWLLAPPLKGPQALLVALCAIALPTAIRAAVDGVVTGCEFTPYLPFVLFAAILAPWWAAGLAAVSAVAILAGLFIHPHQEFSCFVSGAAIFIGASAAIVATVGLIRRGVAALERRGADETAGGIVFSLDRGQVWASWYGQGPPILLGSQRKVSAMMADFLAQSELAKRLNDNSQ